MFSSLSYDILNEITTLLNLNDIRNLSKTCKDSFYIGRNERLWFNLYSRTFSEEVITKNTLQLQDPTSSLSKSIVQFKFPAAVLSSCETFQGLTDKAKVYQFHFRCNELTFRIKTLTDDINRMSYSSKKIEKIKELTECMVKNKDIFLLPLYERPRTIYRNKLGEFIMHTPTLACLTQDYITLFGGRPFCTCVICDME